MSNVAITRSGLNYVMDANSNGPLIAIKYFIPVYDWRIDPTLVDNDGGGTTSLSAISAVGAETEAYNSISATPYGEVLGNYSTVFPTGYYNIDNSKDYVIGGTLAGNNIVQSQMTNGPTHVNTFVLENGTVLYFWTLYSGQTGSVPLYRATSFSNLENGSWSGTGTSALWPHFDHFDNIASYSYPISEYSPIVDYDGNIKGNVYCKLPAIPGTFKYNKIALIAVKIDDNGNEIAGSKCFFAEAYFSTPITKSSVGLGYNETTIDVQLTLSATGGGDWNNIFYSTSGDYWLKTPEGLHTSENISVGSNTLSNKLNEIGVATVHIGTDNIDTTERLRIDVKNNQSIYDYFSLKSYNSNTLGSVLDWNCPTSSATWIFNNIKLGTIDKPITQVTSSKFQVSDNSLTNIFDKNGIIFNNTSTQMFEIRNSTTEEILLATKNGLVIAAGLQNFSNTVTGVLSATISSYKQMNLVANTIKVFTSAIIPYNSSVNLGSQSLRFNKSYFNNDIDITGTTRTMLLRPDCSVIGSRQLLLGTTYGTSADRIIVAAGANILNTSGNGFDSVNSYINNGTVDQDSFNIQAKIDIIGLGGVSIYGPTTFSDDISSYGSITASAVNTTDIHVTTINGTSFDSIFDSTNIISHYDIIDNTVFYKSSAANQKMQAFGYNWILQTQSSRFYFPTSAVDEESGGFLLAEGDGDLGTTPLSPTSASNLYVCLQPVVTAGKTKMNCNYTLDASGHECVDYNFTIMGYFDNYGDVSYYFLLIPALSFYTNSREKLGMMRWDGGCRSFTCKVISNPLYEGKHYSLMLIQLIGGAVDFTNHYVSFSTFKY